MSDVHERLRRLLFVVPYVARHRGVTVDALAKQLGVSREELLRDLELPTMVSNSRSRSSSSRLTPSSLASASTVTPRCRAA